MEWIAGAALLPLLVCGAMCAGGILLAAVGLRRNQDTKSGCCSGDDSKGETASAARSAQNHQVDA